MTHPLERLSAVEIDRNRSIVLSDGRDPEKTRFMLVGLIEPGRTAGGTDRARRRVESVLMDSESGAVTHVVADLDAGSIVTSREIDVVTEGQPPIVAEEFDRVEELLRRDPAWTEAMARREIFDMDHVRISALSAGRFGIEGEEGRRIVRCLAFLQLDDHDNAWAHPIDGVVAYVDLITGEVLALIDDRLFPVPQQRHNFHLPEELPPSRTTQKPIVITQPEGPSFSVEGDVVEWEHWRFRIGFNQVEGLTLHEIAFRDGDAYRSILHRASIAEMVVPYGDPSPVRFWQNYFDAGEYSLGKSANSLELGCDCLGEIRYFDAVIAATDGRPRTIRNAICMHEEDASILWKHTDEYYHSGDVRRNRRLVVSFFITVGNYDYGFYWYLYLDGKIEFECKATGVVFASVYPGDGADGSPYPWASHIAPQIGAPYHQHLFCARLDVAIDGFVNAVDELEAQRVPMGEGNPYGNGFTLSTKRLRTEEEGVRVADASRGRVWHIVNPEVANSVGRPVGFVLRPEGQPTLLADPDSSIARRAAFTTKNLWVTRFDESERFPSGFLVNQNDGYGAIDTWVKDDEAIDGEDIVVWHSFGLTHFPRPEDWPIMPVDSTGFSLVPHGFFDRNPTLDVPAPQPHGSACASTCSAGEGCACHPTPASGAVDGGCCSSGSATGA